MRLFGATPTAPAVAGVDRTGIAGPAGGAAPQSRSGREVQTGPRPQASCDLRRMFDDLTREPLPQGLVELCEQLEDAFRRGDLHCDPHQRAPLQRARRA